MATIRSCFLYEFLIAVTIITVLFQLSVFVDFPREVASHSGHTTSEKDQREVKKGTNLTRVDNNNKSAIFGSNQTMHATYSLTQNVKQFTDHSNCQNLTSNYSILVYGGMSIVKKWVELRELVSKLKEVERNKYTLSHLCRDLDHYGDMFPEGDIYPCESNITITLSSSKGVINGKDVVVLGVSPYSMKIKSKALRTAKFPESQLFVFYGVETPLRMRTWIKDVGMQPVHVVWSYHSLSDIFLPYSIYDPSTPLDAVDRSEEILLGKKRLISWMGSNCHNEVFWPRMKFLNELQKYIPVDMYGKCGNLTCLPRMSEHCNKVMEQYKFYLALENAECEDYITEKFWVSALQHNIVPVVYGAKKENYIKFAPPDSFIHVSDFSSIEQLANYLKILDRNDRLYQRYFAWRTKGGIQQVFPPLQASSFCSLVPQIHQLRRKRLTKSNLHSSSWFQGCRRDVGKKYPDIEISEWTAWK